ncbi:hypothetical protein BN1708_003711 [Verticillium longisporum]|uniref:Uncharacterized protein n=2 Tax=Verticillium longisporum TaxID=100787 RepID=A0A0G4LQM9_VERLO|nr:hypothetical protein BN1708_003711 [Verticillium longisporum]
MPYIVCLLVTSASAQDASVSQLNAHAAIFPNGLTLLNPDTMNALPSASRTVAQWPWGTVPQACHSVASDSSVTDSTPDDLDVFSVRYSDCAIPWTVFRCADADATLKTVVDRLGRIPVLARERIRYVHVHKKISGTSGLSFYWDGDIVLFGEGNKYGFIPT